MSRRALDQKHLRVSKKPNGKPVAGIDRIRAGRADPHTDLAGSGHGVVKLGHGQHVRTAEGIDDNGFHNGSVPADNMAMSVTAGALCGTFGVFFLIAPLRPHPSSEAGSLTGGARVLVQVMGIGSGMWLIALAIAMFGDDGDAALRIIMVGSVMYLIGVVIMLAMLAGGLGRAGVDHRREPEIRPVPPSWPRV